MKEQEYTVRWEIQLTSTDPQAAAEKALAWIKAPDSICHVFSTKDESDNCHTVDLNEEEDDQVLPITLDQFHEMTFNTLDKDKEVGNPQARKEEALHNIDIVIVSCEEGRDGTWDTTTDEGREGFGDMITLLECVKDYIQDFIDVELEDLSDDIDEEE